MDKCSCPWGAVTEVGAQTGGPRPQKCVLAQVCGLEVEGLASAGLRSLSGPPGRPLPVSLSCCWVRPVCWLGDAPCHSPPLASHGLPFVHGHQSHWTEGPPCSSRADWPLLYLQRPCFPIRPHGQVVRGRTRTRLSWGTNVNQEWWVPQHGSSTDQVFPKRSPSFQTQGRGRPAPTP